MIRQIFKYCMMDVIALRARAVRFVSSFAVNHFHKLEPIPTTGDEETDKMIAEIDEFAARRAFICAYRTTHVLKIYSCQD